MEGRVRSVIRYPDLMISLLSLLLLLFHSAFRWSLGWKDPYGRAQRSRVGYQFHLHVHAGVRL